MKNFTVLIARLLSAFIFLESGIGKIGGYAGTQQYMQAHGVPGQLLPLVILLEVGGGLALVLGWHTRIAALLLGAFTLAAALIFHTHFSDHVQWILFMFHLNTIAAFLLLAAHGAGAWSLDGRRRAHG